MGIRGNETGGESKFFGLVDSLFMSRSALYRICEGSGKDENEERL